MKIAILGSTRGTVSECILRSIRNGILTGIKVECIISNRSNAQILEKARKYDVTEIVLNVRKQNNELISREDYDDELDKILTKHRIDYVLLIGWMRLLSTSFVKKWENKILNIHPSLLPAYAGEMDLNIHRAVLDRGCKITGATLMYIDEGPDTGPIIDQRTVRIDHNDDAESLKAKVQSVEQDLLLDFLPLLRDGNLKVINKKVIFQGGANQ
jgi:phosphoribosylglycinamide formyltransferase 1